MKIKGKANLKLRLYILVGIILSSFLVFAGRMIGVQVIDYETYAQAANSTVRRNVEVEAARGEILDRNGSPLVVNRQGNSLVFDAAYFPSSEEQESRNEIILSLINLMKTQGEEWNDTLPLVFGSDGKIAYKEDSETDIEYLKSKEMLHLNDYATAQDCFDGLIEKYSLQKYSQEEARNIASVCYGMAKNLFSVSSPYTFAEDVSTETVSKVKENSTFYKGVDVEVVPYREYVDGTLAPHVIGRVGAIDADEYAELKEKGYKMDDLVGKDGIEAVMEEYLRGENGQKTVTTDKDGNVSVKYTKDPVQGNTIVLTLSKPLQEAANKALAEVVEDLISKGYSNSAGSAVVMDVHTGEVLACTSYPTFDISTYSENAAKLNSDPGAPLWNRALLSAYAPGSTFKPLIGLAGLEEGIITKDTTFNCNGSYWRFPNQFYCLENNGNINVVHALEHSCNVFFYETGYQLGIDKINYYASKMGFGQKTGIELPEVSGMVANPEEFAQNHAGAQWMVGDTVQASIGQSDTLVTPIQLATYCATIANGGTRYVPHIVKSVKSYDYSSTVLDKQPQVALETGFSQQNLGIIKEGMSLVSEYTGSATHVYLDNYEPKIACKTGTAEVYAQKDGKLQKQTNCFLITFAPYDDPEIAIAVSIEDAKNSSYTAKVAKAIYDAYFNDTSSIEAPQQVGQLLY